MTRSTLLAAIFLGAVLPWLPGCAGGCGEDTTGKSDGKPEESAGSMTPGKAGGGSAGLNRSRFDSADKKSTSTALGQAGEEAGKLSARPVREVSPEDFRRKVLRPGATVFLTVVRSACEDCAAVLPVLKPLASKFNGRYEFYEFDGAAAGAGGLLPAGLSLEPLPAFAMYKDGKATSWLQGLPFPREADAKGAYTEPLGGYQRRLLRWFNDALVQKNLNFSRTLRKAPRSKI